MAQTATKTKRRGNKEKAVYPAPLLYPDSEDIFNRFYEEQDTGLTDITQTKEPAKSEKVPGKYAPGSELDVPGSELDDVQENTGSEDEENNYYSIGGDNHNNLDEDKGE